MKRCTWAWETLLYINSRQRSFRHIYILGSVASSIKGRRLIYGIGVAWRQERSKLR